MKKDYNRSISLRCATCGDMSSFEFSEDKSWVKCEKCGKEYLGGYDELVELNQPKINKEVEQMKEEVSEDLKKEVNKMLRDTFKGNKNIKLK